MSVFNQFVGTRDAEEKALISAAVAKAKAPNQMTAGNAAGINGGSSNLVTGTPDDEIPIQIGIDPDGTYWRPFTVGIDYVGAPGAYVMDSNVIYDYGN